MASFENAIRQYQSDRERIRAARLVRKHVREDHGVQEAMWAILGTMRLRKQFDWGKIKRVPQL